MNKAVEGEVWQRARGLCEYCQVAQTFDPLPFQIDHIIAQKHGGATVSQNLALSCFHCNSHKGPNIAGLDPAGGELVRLYHPRRDIWDEHFEWLGPVLLGRTPVGRVTVHVLVINHPEQVAVRQSLIWEGSFPPPISPP